MKKTLIAAAALAVTAHVAQIRYKVQWYIPENLQSNYIERLYESFVTATIPASLSADEKRNLKNKIGSTNENR